MRYKLMIVRPDLCYVHNADMNPAPLPWEGVTAVYRGPEKPIHIAGPFDLPPFVQEALFALFKDVNGRPEGEDRTLYIARLEPAILTEPTEPTVAGAGDAA